MGSRMEKQYDILEGILAGVAKPRNLPLSLLEDITEHFSEARKIGQGGFATVYKGVLRNKNVAVKKTFVNKDTVDEKLFCREVESLMRINNHPNLVRFLGFCSNTARAVEEHTGSKETFYPQIIDRLLCFEYISNGSLDKHITDEFRGLTWDKRFDIIRGVCEGLRYLHEDKRIIHMDLKPSNILLDDHMVPKITDFGLSRSAENTHTKGQRFGTAGYWAPEYEKHGNMSDRADIYSLGIIIIELVTGSKHVPDETRVLRRWRHRWNKPPTQNQHQQVIKCMEIAVCCSEHEPGNRPSISDIIGNLSETGSANGPIGQKSLYLYDDMLGVEPLELHFPLEHNEQTSCSVELTNKTINSIAFNIRTPSKQYNTWPYKGIVLPGHKLDVKITLQPQESALQVTNSDKFVVQSTQVNEGLADEDITDHIFKKNGGKKVVDEVNLMVVYEPQKYQVDLSNDQQEEVVSKGIGSSSYNNTIYSSRPLKSFAWCQAASLASDQTMDLATGAIRCLLPKLNELLKKFSLETSIMSDVCWVIQELTVIHADLCNVSEVQRDNNNEQIKLAKFWADEVRELSYDIEDVVDGFLMHVQGTEPDTSMGGLTELIQKIGGEIKNIKYQVQHMSGWKGKYKVEECVPNIVSTISAHHLPAMFKDRKELVGINNAIKDFTNRLRGVDDKELKVHSIVGSGGLGKTTLARAVYNQLTGSFSLMAFVPVGQNPNVKKLLLDILFELDKRSINSKPEKLDETKLINKITELQKNKRYLIVLDDLWDKKIWHRWIKFAFMDSKCGSKIIITTRKFEVAEITTHVYKLDPLSDGYSEELFYATLSPQEGRCQYDLPDKVITKILSKCGGVPLAIITIASLLASKQREDWPKVYNSIGFGPEVNEDVDMTREILLFSYSDLPRPLRTCLLHLSIYPEEYLIPKDTAIWKWIAEGFIHEEPGKGLFELGERYFNQLVSRSMIELAWTDTGGFSLPKVYFRIHDLVLDMICSLSKDENFVTILEGDEQQISSEKGARRLAVQKRNIEQPDPLINNCMLQLRSFYATDCRIGVMPPLSSFKVLRVLSMEKCKFNNDQPYQLIHIGKLLQLRYLNLRRMSIIELPEEIGDLLFLQTLILDRTETRKLPGSLGRLRRLKCLHVRNQLQVPDWMVNMTSLEELSLVVHNTPLGFAEGLGNLKELRDLQIRVAGKHGDNWNRALVKSIGNLLHLQSLAFMPGDNLEGFVPPLHLHSMTLHMFHSSVSPWMDSAHLPSLSYLQLNSGNLDARCLEILGRLPELHTLTLSNFRILAGPSICLTVTGSGAFPKLRHLYTQIMLKFQHGVMPRLEYLELHAAPQKLEMDNFDCDFTSLGNLPLLQKLGFLYVGLCYSDADAEYKKRMEAAVEHALDRHPHRRPIFHLISE